MFGKISKYDIEYFIARDFQNKNFNLIKSNIKQKQNHGSLSGSKYNNFSFKNFF